MARYNCNSCCYNRIGFVSPFFRLSCLSFWSLLLWSTWPRELQPICSRWAAPIPRLSTLGLRQNFSILGLADYNSIFPIHAEWLRLLKFFKLLAVSRNLWNWTIVRGPECAFNLPSCTRVLKCAASLHSNLILEPTFNVLLLLRLVASKGFLYSQLVHHDFSQPYQSVSFTKRVHL